MGHIGWNIELRLFGPCWPTEETILCDSASWPSLQRSDFCANNMVEMVPTANTLGQNYKEVATLLHSNHKKWTHFQNSNRGRCAFGNDSFLALFSPAHTFLGHAAPYPVTQHSPWMPSALPARAVQAFLLLQPQNKIYFFFFFFAKPLGLWDLSSLTRDWTLAPGSESAESWPLDRQGIPTRYFLNLENPHSLPPLVFNITFSHLLMNGCV